MYVRGYLQGSENGRVVTIRDNLLKPDVCCMFYYMLYFSDTLASIQHPVWGPARVHIVDRPISDEQSLGIKHKYTPRAVVRLVIIINCLSLYDHESPANAPKGAGRGGGS
jgi:hypothetical protein